MAKYVVLIYASPTQGYSNERRRDIHQVKRIYAPLSIMYLTATLQEADIPVLMIDHRLTPTEEIVAQVSKLPGISMVGFSSMTGSQITNSLAIARALRDGVGDDFPFVWGGVHPTIFPEKTIQHPLVDVIVYGEGDYSVVALARALAAGEPLSTVGGICYLDGDRVCSNPPLAKIDPLDVLPIPAWEPLREYLNPAQYPILATISTSRGCPYSCTYCYKRGVDVVGSGSVWRPFSAERILREVDYLYEQFGFDIYETSDENFILQPDRAVNIIRGFKERGFKISAIRSNFHTYRDPVIGELEGFCDYVGYSPETASPRIQTILDKKADYEEMKKLNARLRDLGIVTVHNFIFGFPFEEEADIGAIVRLCTEFKKINPATRMSLYQYMPYPGAPLTDMMTDEYGLVLPDDLEAWGKSDMYGELSLRFRPWISEEYVKFLNAFQLLFNIVFNSYQPLDSKVEELYHSFPKVRELFGDLNSIPRTPVSPVKPALNERLSPDLLEHFQDRLFI